MRLKQLRQKLTTPVFFDYQVERWFADEPKRQINVQLARFVRAGELQRLKRGVYMSAESQIDELAVANLLYRPSYVSLETALNSYGIIPDVTATITSVSPITAKRIETVRGVFAYSKIAAELYFGFTKVKDANSQVYYDIATPEKALLDYVYIRKIRDLEEQRVEMNLVDQKKLELLAKLFPDWVERVVL